MGTETALVAGSALKPAWIARVSSFITSPWACTVRLMSTFLPQTHWVVGIHTRHELFFSIQVSQLVNDTEPVVDNGLCRIAPGVIEMLLKILVQNLDQCIRIIERSLYQPPRLAVKVVFRKWRHLIPLACDKAQYFTLVFLQQAVAVVFRVTLKIDDAHLVRADGKVHAAVVTFSQYSQSRRLQLRARNIVVSGVRHIEACIDVVGQRMLGSAYPVTVNTPAFVRERLPVNAVQTFEQ